MFKILPMAGACLSLLMHSTAAVSEISMDKSQEEILVVSKANKQELEELKTASLGIGINSEQIAAINTINAEDVIRYAPALIVRKRYIGDANATLSFRNMHTQQTPRALVTVDGFTISDFLGANFTTAPKWGVLSPNDVEGVEIIYGPTSARYSGHSMGGTMLIKTPDIKEAGAWASAQIFSQNYKYYQTDEDLFGWAVDSGFDFTLGDRGGISLSYRHFENEGQPQDWKTVSGSSLYGSQGIIDEELSFLRIGAQGSVVDSTEDQIRLRAHYDLGGGWRMRALAALLIDDEEALNPKSFLVDNNGEETFIGITGANAGVSNSAELLTGIGISGELAEWDIDLSISRFDILNDKSRTSDNFDAVTGLRPVTGRQTVSDAWWNSFEGVAERQLGDHDLALGLSYAGYSDNNRTYNTADWLRASNTGLRDSSGGDTRLLGAFVEDAVNLSSDLTATFGLRFETWRASDGFLINGGTTVNYDSRSKSAWSPKAALTYKPDNLSEITGSVSLATRFPTVRELYQAGLISYGANVGELDLNGFNPNLKPEKALDIQLTASRRFGNTKFTVSGYHQGVKDTIFTQSIAIPDPVTSDLFQSSLATNIDKVNTWGVDFIIAADNVLIEGLAVDANVSWIDAEVTRNALNPALVGNKFPRVPKWRANASVRYSPNDDWVLAAGIRHQSTPDRNIENNSTSLCDTFYCVSKFSFVDLKATRKMGAFTLAAGVDNLFNEKAFVYHPYPGRTFVLSLKWDGR